MSVDQDIVDSTETLKADVKITHDIVHGSDTTSVTTEGGAVPSHAKVAKDSHDEIVEQLQPTVTSINEHARLVTDKAGDAAISASEAEKSEKNAAAIVYEGKAALEPTPGSIPVADSEAKIHHDWLPDQSIPFPDFWLPLNDSLQIMAGEGRHDQIDVSAAQDGSVMVDLQTKSAEFSRSTTATYIDKSGMLRTAGVNEPRFDGEGILREGDSTNIVSTNDLISWSRGSSSEATYESIPDFLGGNTGIRITAKKGGGVYLTNVFPSTDGMYTASVYARAIKGTPKLIVGHEGISGVEVQLTSEWVRHSVTSDTRGATAFVLYLRNEDDGDVVEIQLPQAEPLPFASSYIPTNGSPVSRASDTLTFSSKNMSHPSMPSTFAADIEWKKINSSSTSLRLSATNGYYHWYYSTSGQVSGLMETRWGGNPIGLESGILDAGVKRNITVFDGSRLKGFNNGKIYMNSGYTPIATSVSDSVYLGYSDSFFGHFKNVRVWHKALTDAQIAALGAAQ